MIIQRETRHSRLRLAPEQIIFLKSASKVVWLVGAFLRLLLTSPIAWPIAWPISCLIGWLSDDL